jgi:hypothetical protein
MSPAEQNYAVGNKEMLAIVMSCCHRCDYVEGAKHPVEVLTNYPNLQKFMTTKSLTGWQARWWETLSGYKLNMVNRAGKKNHAGTRSHWLDYPRAQEGLCAATVLTAHCNAAFCLQQMYAPAVQEDQIFEDVPHDALYDLNQEGLAENHTAKEACTALGPLSGNEAENHTILAVLLPLYSSHRKQHHGILYYLMQLYIPAVGGARTKALRHHHDDPIARHFNV